MQMYYHTLSKIYDFLLYRNVHRKIHKITLIMIFHTIDEYEPNMILKEKIISIIVIVLRICLFTKLLDCKKLC